MRGRVQSEFHSDTLFFKYPFQPLLLTVFHSPLTIFSEGKKKCIYYFFFSLMKCWFVLWWTTCMFFFFFSPLTCVYLSVLCVSAFFFFLSLFF